LSIGELRADEDSISNVVKANNFLSLK